VLGGNCAKMQVQVTLDGLINLYRNMINFKLFYFVLVTNTRDNIYNNV
jgi:hypothetical protein